MNLSKELELVLDRSPMLAGHGGRGVGKQRVTQGAPAAVREGERTDEERRLLSHVVGGPVVLLSPESPSLAQGSQSRRVEPALGREVAAETEHMGPPAETLEGQPTVPFHNRRIQVGTRSAAPPAGFQ